MLQAFHPLGGSNGSITLMPVTVPAGPVVPVSAFSFESEDFMSWGSDGMFADDIGCGGVIDPLPCDPEFGVLFDGLLQ